MSETHATNGSAVTSDERVVTPPKRDRAEYMREYRARRAANNQSQESNSAIKPEAEIAHPEIKPEPELELNKPGEQISAEQYQQKIVPEADEATRALKARIAEIEQSAELNRQYQAERQAQAHMGQRPLTRGELLEQWRHQGMSHANLKFLEAHPELIDAWQLTRESAIRAANEGHVPDTDDHRHATKRIFDGYLAEIKRQDAEPSPKFFQPPPPPAPRRPPGKASIVSAPVSRETPSSRIYEAENNPKSVHLSVDQLEAARIAGVTPGEYAKQLLKMRRMQASGESQP
jgi:hypothetical protein